MRAAFLAKPGSRTSRSRLFLERKLMSTKTSFKRVSAVAAAAALAKVQKKLGA